MEKGTQLCNDLIDFRKVIGTQCCQSKLDTQRVSHGYRVRIKYHLNSRIVSTININLIKSLKPIKFDLPVATSSVSLSNP